MALKFVTFCALFAMGNAGGLIHPVSYTQFHNVAVAHPSVDEAHRGQYSQETEESHIHYVPAYAKTVNRAASAHSGAIYESPAFTHVIYGGHSNGRSLEHQKGPSSTPSSYVAEETTTAVSVPAESTTPKTKDSHLKTKSAEPEPTQASYLHEPVSSPGYSYSDPTASSPSAVVHSSSKVPTFYQTSSHPVGGHHVSTPSFVKYEVPAHTLAPVHYTAPVQTVYHKTIAPQPVHVKYSNPEAAVYTSVGEHASAVYSHQSAQAATVHHHNFAVPQQPSLVRYTVPAPNQVTYGASAPAVYTKHSITEPTSHVSHTIPASAPIGFLKYSSPAATAHVTYIPPQHSAPAVSHVKSESLTKSQSPSPITEENKDIIDVESPESTKASLQSARTYLPPATHLVSHTYQVPAEQHYTSHQESARSHLTEHNIWPTDGAASHVSFSGFGTSYGY